MEASAGPGQKALRDYGPYLDICRSWKGRGSELVPTAYQTLPLWLLAPYLVQH